MKKLILTLLVMIAFSFTTADFCNGWENGYEEGYCYDEYSCLSPPAPACPAPGINETGYTDGYNRGFRTGLSDAGKN